MDRVDTKLLSYTLKYVSFTDLDRLVTLGSDNRWTSVQSVVREAWREEGGSLEIVDSEASSVMSSQKNVPDTFSLHHSLK